MELVTGGTGFVGAHVVRELLRRGGEVRCLVRSGSRRDNLEGLDVEILTGDLLEPESLSTAVAGCQRVYHCAADYRLYAKDPQEIYRTNVEGTRHVLRAAADAGVERVVYTSSVGALGLVDGGVADESTPSRFDSMIGHYKRSKYLAERVAEEMAGQGVPVVIVNPSTPIGELDIKPTPTGQIIVDYLNGRMPAYVDTGLNLIDVRDVAVGHWLAAERGSLGERYILGHRNLTLREVLDLLSELTGLPRVRLRVPHALPFAAALVSTAWSRWTGSVPKIPLESVRMAKKRMFFDASRAVDQLGLPQSPIEEALRRACEWFRDHGYTRCR